MLLDHGFEIVTKVHRIGRLDASFAVGRGIDEEFVIVESRGPDRNTDYREGLERLLAGLGREEVRLLDAFVDSTKTRAAGAERERLAVANRDYPIQVAGAVDASELAREQGRSAAATGRAPGASGDGNRTKRLRLIVDVPEGVSLASLAERLADGGSSVGGQPGRFRFTASAPGEWVGSANRQGVEASEVQLHHKQMQKVLYQKLVAEHGAQNVASELPMASEMPADLVVQTQYGLIIYEVKMRRTARECVREALGQLLEYGCWPGSDRLARLVVVGPCPLDVATKSYLEVLHERFRLDLEYVEQPMQSGHGPSEGQS